MYQINGLVEVSGFDIYEALQKAKALKEIESNAYSWAYEEMEKEWKTLSKWNKFKWYLQGRYKVYWAKKSAIIYKYFYKVYPKSYMYLTLYFDSYFINKVGAFNEVNKLFMNPNSKYLLTPDQAQFVKDFKDIAMPPDVDTAMKINSFKGEKK